MTRWNQGGFTLVEMLLVIAIIGILIAIGFQAMLPMIRGARLDNAVADVSALTRYAVSTTRRQNQSVTMTIDTNRVQVNRGATVLQSRELQVVPVVECRTINCSTLPVTLTFRAPFGTSTQDFRVTFQQGRSTRSMWVRGPGAVVVMQ